MTKFIMIPFFAIFWLQSVSCVCEFPTILTCRSEETSVTLCLAQEPNTCTSSSPCHIIAVYDQLSDPNQRNNLLLPSPIDLLTGLLSACNKST